MPPFSAAPRLLSSHPEFLEVRSSECTVAAVYDRRRCPISRSSTVVGYLLSLQLRKQKVQPKVAEFFVNRVLFEPGVQVLEIDMVHGLVLIKTGKNNGFLARRGIHVLLEALRADLFHHALHRRVDACDRDVIRLKQALENTVPCVFDGSHHSVGPDRNDPPDL